MVSTRRTLLSGIAGMVAAQAQKSKQESWNPRLGIYCKYSPGNIDFARQEGFSSVQLTAQKPLDRDMTDEQLAGVKDVIRRSGLFVSVLGAPGNHIEPDLAARARINNRFVKMIELAGRMGVRNLGTASGTMPGQPLAKQVDQVVRVYTEKYFPACEKHNVRILWEPWAGGPNIATGPVGYAALFKALDNSPHVGLQFDPSHFVWQMMDPIECAREFIDKIHDVHLKDTEILWPVLRRVGIHPLDNTRWWRFRLPGSGSIEWKAFFTVLMEAGYTGAMNIENEDQLYYPNYDGAEMTDQFKRGFRVAHAYLKQFVPERRDGHDLVAHD